MRVVTLLLRHGTEKYSHAEEQLSEIFARQLPGVERKTIVLDNSLPPAFEEWPGDSSVLLAGDNSSWEFSAWDKGLQYLGEEIWSYDFVQLVTSAFNTLYTAYLDRFDESLLHAAAGRPVCVGHIDAYNEAVKILSFRSQHWMRTSFFFAAPAELKMLRSLVSVENSFDIFGQGIDEPFSLTSVVSKRYQSYILDWLTGSDIGQGVKWHSRFDVDPQAWPMFKAKATAILNEHLLAIRLRSQGTRLIDTTWLATQLKDRPAGEVDWTTPWRTQLAERAVDKVTVF